MDLDSDPLFYCWGELLKYSAGEFTILLISKIHTKPKIRDRNLSPSKVDTLLWKVSMTLNTFSVIDTFQSNVSTSDGLRF